MGDGVVGRASEVQERKGLLLEGSVDNTFVGITRVKKI